MQKKHGPDVTDLALKQRAIDGASPITVSKGDRFIFQIK